MVITYYADVIFIFNLVVDFTLLLIIHPKQKKRYGRLFGAAVSGAVVAVLLLVKRIPVWGYIAGRLVIAVLMTGIGIPYKGIGELFCNTALLYGTGAAVYGISFLWLGKTLVHSKGNYLFPIAASTLIFAGRCLYFFRERRKHANQYRCEVVLMHSGKSMKLKAFYDSGNHLYEPFSGYPVILVNESVLKGLGIIREEHLRAVPYQAVGSADGILYAYPVEQLMIPDGNKKKTLTSLYAAVVPEELLRQEECDVILHGSFV